MGMRPKRTFPGNLFPWLLMGCLFYLIFLAAAPPPPEINIIPRPYRVELSPGSLRLTDTSAIIINQEIPELISLAEVLRQDLCRLTTRAWEIKSVSESKSLRGVIYLRLLPPKKEENPEAYELRVNSRYVLVDAWSPAGIFYGIQTFRQLLAPEMKGLAPGSGKELRVPRIKIIDRPRFRWRGIHVDVSRHFFPKEWVIKLLDVAAAYKLNTFHWHLTDDQGWRLEIKRYPRLSEVAAWRRETMEDGQPYGGFYTQAEVREIVNYARERFISVVPEIEMPGHSLAALAAYPELSCSGGPFKVATEWGVMNDVFCAGSEATFDFLENVLSEVIDLFPGEFVHIGGDEVPKVRWKNCLRCQTRIKEEGLKDESELQSYFVRRIENFLNSKGRRLIGWDEILEGGLPARAVVMSWRGMAGGIEAARNGHDAVMSPTSHCYFDYYQGRVDEPKAIGGFLPIEKVYSFEPVPAELKPAEIRHILGAQANLWTEYIETPEQAEYMLFPRLLALAEVVWSPKEKNWPDFARRLLAHYDFLAQEGINFRVPPPEGIGGRQRLMDKLRLSLTPPVPGAKILYTLDGKFPDGSSPIYANPIEIEGNKILRAVTLLANGRFSHPVSMYFFQVDETKNGLFYDYFEGTWERLPDLDKETPLRSGITFELTLEGIPTRPDYFALRFRGWLVLEEAGEYTFIARANDGLRLWVDNQAVVENCGLFGRQEIMGKIQLSSGKHRLEVEYLEKTGGQFLEVFIQGPSLPYQPLPPGRLFRE